MRLSSVRPPVWLGWAMANAVCGVVIGFASVLQFLAYFLLNGLIVGVVQGLAMRYYSRSVHWGGWILATAAGWFIVTFILAPLNNMFYPLVDWLMAIAGGYENLWLLSLIYLVILGAVGAAQSILLARQTRYAVVWILMSAVGGGVFGGAGTLIPDWPWWLQGLGLGAYGLLTGVVLQWVLSSREELA